MTRMQIQLTDTQIDALRRRSRRQNVSVSELVRQAIDVFTRTEPPSGRELRDRAILAAGRFASGSRDTSSNHDAAFAEALDQR
jgi:hypothetical protein